MTRVGVRPESNDVEFHVSANVLKHVEFDRLTVSPKRVSKAIITELDDEDADATTDGQLLSHLVDVVSEVDLDETGVGSLCDLQVSNRKSKSTLDKKNKKMSKRTKLSKYPIVPK